MPKIKVPGSKTKEQEILQEVITEGQEILQEVTTEEVPNTKIEGQKFLQQTTTGEVYIYTDILAMRDDMVGYNPLTKEIIAKGSLKVE